MLPRIVFRAFCRYLKIAGEFIDKTDLLKAAQSVIGLYLELLSQGHGVYTRETPSQEDENEDDGDVIADKSGDLVIQQNSLSYQILDREFRQIRKMLLEIEGGGIVVATACIDYISKFFDMYKRQVDNGWILTNGFAEYILDKCNCLVHTIGQEYLLTSDAKTELIFANSLKLQEQLSSLNADFCIDLTEYFRYKMAKYMKANDENSLSLWQSVLEYLVSCEKYGVCNDSLKDLLMGFHALSDVEQFRVATSNNLEDFRDAINRVKELAEIMIAGIV